MTRANVPTGDGQLVVPQTSQQRRLWFLEQLTPGTSRHNLVLVFRRTGGFDVGAFRRALIWLVDRHDALRCSFRDEDGVPVADVAAHAEPAVDVVEVGSDAEAVAWIDALASAPFHLSRPPMIRAGVACVGDASHLATLVVHHLACDQWSLRLVERDLWEAYDAFASGVTPEATRTAGYAEYASSQAASAAAGTDAALDHWVAHLDGAPLLLDLPREPGAGSIDPDAAASRLLSIPASVVAVVAALARRERASTYMVVLAAYAATLGRFCNADDVVVGVPLDGRTSNEVRDIVGLFAGIVPLRVPVGGDLSFRAVLAAVRAGSLAARRQQAVALDALVEALRPARDAGRQPIVQATCSWEGEVWAGAPAPEPATASSGAAVVERVGRAHPGVRFELELYASTRADGGLAVRLTYPAGYLDADTVARLGDEFADLLGRAARSPDEPLRTLATLPPADREAVHRWGVRRVPLDVPGTLVAAFEVAAASHPDSNAVVDGDGGVTYAELDASSRSVAAFLQARGTQRGDVVVVVADRGVTLVTAALGIVRAGAAYAPVDASYPAARVAEIVRQCGSPVVLTDRPREGVDAVTVAEALAAAEGRAPDVPIDGSDLAYVVFTSGSTGIPKGVMVEHRSLMNLVAWHRRRFGVGTDDRGSQLASPAFDAFGWEVWPYLTAGASVAVAPADARYDGAALAAWFDHAGVTVGFVPTALVEDTAAALSRLRPPRLRTLLTGGDRLAAAPPRCGVDVVNNYGPTEATVVATSGTVTGEGTPTIGRPIDNVVAVVLDRAFRLSPIGVVGELFLGGVAVSRGYIGRQDLTDERFLTVDVDGFGARRLYRTGDRVRWRPDGTLEYVGRTDGQVQVRGHRVECGEVEAVLRACPGVDTAAVVAADTPAGVHLVALVVAAVSVEAATVRAFVAGRLPPYMVPARVVDIDALPITTNGKVDRAQLVELARAAEPAADDPDDGSPRADAERVVAGMWQRVLGIARVGPVQDFFELGGHSLLATRLVAQIEATFGVRLPLRTIFDRPTVRGQVEAIEDAIVADLLAEG